MKEFEKVYFLLILAELGANSSGAFLSTRIISDKTGLSQQSISRKLIELSYDGLIERKVTNKGQQVFITNKGLELLVSFYYRLKQLVEKEKEIFMILRGTVFSGLGEGKYYMSIPYYVKQFKERLGFKPYPGTLNIRLDYQSIKNRKVLERLPGILIKGFRNEHREYGGAKVFKAIINDKIEGAVLLIDRTYYGPDVLEIISKEKLRRVLSLKNGDVVCVKIFI